MNSTTVSVAVEQGPRFYQEDRFVWKAFPANKPRNVLLAVMDGHGGNEISSLCSSELWNLFRTCREADPVEKLKHLFALLDQKTNKVRGVGSTLSVAWIRQNRCDEVVVGVLGDSPVIVVDHFGNITVSPEHNITNPTERRMVMTRGAFRCDNHYHYNTSGSGIQLSRALGDAEFGSVISRTPDVFRVSNPQYVVVASDGVFDAGHRDTSRLIEDLVSRLKPEFGAQDIMSWAKERGLKDNATALLWNAHWLS